MRAPAPARTSPSRTALWLDDADHGYYRIHKHLAPDHIEHSFNEDDVIAIGNAAAVFYGLAEPEKVPRILADRQDPAVDPGRHFRLTSREERGLDHKP